MCIERICIAMCIQGISLRLKIYNAGDNNVFLGSTLANSPAVDVFIDSNVN